MPLHRQSELLEMLAESTSMDDILEICGVEPITVLKWLKRQRHLDLEDFYPDMGEEYDE